MSNRVIKIHCMHEKEVANLFYQFQNMGVAFEAEFDGDYWVITLD